MFYRFDKMENGSTSVGYMRLKEFNALARKDLLIGITQINDSYTFDRMLNYH